MNDEEMDALADSKLREYRRPETAELTTLRAQLTRVTEEKGRLRDKAVHHDDLVSELGQAKRERDEAREQLAQVQRAAAHLREAVGAHTDGRFDELPVGEAVANQDAITKAALSTEAGKGWVSPEEYQALQKAEGAILKALDMAYRHLDTFGCIQSNIPNDPIVSSQERFFEAYHAAKKDAGQGYLTEAECQARVDAAVRATWEEAAKVANGFESSDLDSSIQEGIASALRARASGKGGRGG